MTKEEMAKKMRSEFFEVNRVYLLYAKEYGYNNVETRKKEAVMMEVKRICRILGVDVSDLSKLMNSGF